MVGFSGECLYACAFYAGDELTDHSHNCSGQFQVKTVDEPLEGHSDHCDHGNLDSGGKAENQEQDEAQTHEKVISPASFILFFFLVRVVNSRS